VLDALDALPRPPGLVALSHELTPCARTALADGRLDAVIAQDPGHIVRSALRVLRARRGGAPLLDAQERIRIEIVIRENLP
jgi:LacI family transcriptional regulator